MFLRYKLEKFYQVMADTLSKKVVWIFRRFCKRKNLVFIIPGIFIVLILPAVLFILSVYFGAFGPLPDRDELQDYHNATASLVFSEEGKIIGRFFSENRTNVAYRQIPPHLLDALIATEDVRFYRHRGIDTRSLVRVFVKTVLLNDRGSGGGSTISQQLAKNLFGRNNYGILSVPANKVREIILARRIENTFSKRDILILYLNTVSFGENVYGIEAASRRFFNKHIEDINIEESAILIGMLKANTLFNPRLHPENSRSRRNTVLSQMAKYNFLDPHKADSLSRLPLKLNYSNLEARYSAGYFLVQVRKEAEQILQIVDSLSGKEWNIEEDGLVINTTLNLVLQNHALKAFRDHLAPMQQRLRNQYLTRAGQNLLSGIADTEIRRLGMTDRRSDTIIQRTFDWEGSFTESLTVLDSIKKALTLLHGGLVVLDPSTGAVRTWVGGIDHLTQPFDQVLARRQLASAFKPVLYAAALEQGIEPCHYYANDSIVLADFEDWTPSNYDNVYGGHFTLTESLARSLNVPTYNLFMDVEFDKIDSLWKNLGFAYPLINIPSVSLGTAEANILETAAAYSAFANGGYRIHPWLIESILTPGGELIYQADENREANPVLSGRSVLLMQAMLQKAIDEGTGSALRNVYGVTFPLAGKTGTSQNYADAWFAAFNPEFVMVSRTGASSRAIRFDSGVFGSSSALALPLVAMTLQNVQQDPQLAVRFSAPFPSLPADLEGALDCPEFRDATGLERFLDLFRRPEILPRREKPEPEPGGSFLRRLFRRRN